MDGRVNLARLVLAVVGFIAVSASAAIPSGAAPARQRPVLTFPTGTGWTSPLPATSAYDDKGFADCDPPYLPDTAHLGADASAPAGTPVRVLSDGVVTRIDTVPLVGSFVSVTHQSSAGLFVAVYGQVATSVAVGDPVAAGETLATVFDQGSSTHFHLAVHPLAPGDDPADVVPYGNTPCVSGVADSRGMVDPIPWLSTHRAESATSITGTVTAAGGGPVSGVWVAALRSADFALAGGAVTAADGTYRIDAPAGAYFLYLIDPAGGHAVGFHGAPSIVTVTEGFATTADPTITPLEGTLRATITSQGTGAPVPDAWALSLDAATGRPGLASTGAATGVAALDGLDAGPHLLALLDPAGLHAPEFHEGQPSTATATPITTPPGASVEVAASLVPQSGPGTGAVLGGTVSTEGSTDPVPGALVVAVRAADFRLAAADATDPTGEFSITVAPGFYRLLALDPTGAHDAEWHVGQTYDGLATSTAVEAPASVLMDLPPRVGTMAGTVTDAYSGSPLAGAWVLALGPSGIAGGAVTGGDGTYDIPGLPPGTYRAAFVDPTGEHPLEYWANSADYAGADTLLIAAGDTTIIDAEQGVG